MQPADQRRRVSVCVQRHSHAGRTCTRIFCYVCPKSMGGHPVFPGMRAHIIMIHFRRTPPPNPPPPCVHQMFRFMKHFNQTKTHCTRSSSALATPDEIGHCNLIAHKTVRCDKQEDLPCEGLRPSRRILVQFHVVNGCARMCCAHTKTDGAMPCQPKQTSEDFNARGRSHKKQLQPKITHSSCACVFGSAGGNDCGGQKCQGLGTECRVPYALCIRKPDPPGSINPC